MFYYLSKFVWFFLQPSWLLIFMTFAGALMAWTRWAPLGRRLVLIGSGLLLVFGLSPMGNILILPLEERFHRPDLSSWSSPPKGIIVLGGAIMASVSKARGVLALNEAGERLVEVVELAHRFPSAKIVFSGGSAMIFYDNVSEADGAQLYFRKMRLDANRLTLENRSRNTSENALYTKALLQPKPGERWLLITSALHMPRAIGCFQRVGFDVIAWPVDYRTRGPGDAYRLFDKPSEGLRRMDTVLREWTGLFAYWLTGRTKILFPGP